MNSSNLSESHLLQARVQHLEAEIRRMRQLGLGACALLILLLLGLRVADHHRFATGQLTAQTFTLADRQGQARAKLDIFPEGSGLEIYAANGERRAQLVGGGAQANLNLYLPVTAVQEAASINFLHDNRLLTSLRTDANGASLELHSKAANGSAILGMQGTTASLLLSGSDEKVPKLLLTANPTQACTALGGVEETTAGGSFCLHSPGLPSLELADVVGNRAVVGIPHNSDLNMEEGSAASLILKHKSGNKVHVTPH